MVDGRLDDEAWSAAAWSSYLTPLSDRDSLAEEAQVRYHMLADDEALYIGVIVQDEHITAVVTADHMRLYETDPTIEIFLDPRADGHRYYELQLNALATRWELVLTQPYREGGRAIDPYTLPDLEHAVHIAGSINDESDIDDYWSVELKIPWTSFAHLDALSIPPRSGESWAINVAYVHTVGGQQHYSSWSPISRRNLHLPDEWGLLKF